MIVTLKSVHRLDVLLDVAGLARSTYFYHLKRLGMPNKHDDLEEEIKKIFFGNKKRFGYRRVWLELRSQGIVANHKLVYKIMDANGWKSKVRKKSKYNSYQGTISTIAENVLDRNFTPTAPNMAWVSDVTEFKVAGQKLYLSPVMDLYDRSILAHELATKPTTKFTATSLRNAIAWHDPGEGLIVHTDQGFQYQHSSWQNLISSCGGVQSMSRKGNCYDNAVMENFFGHLKSEMFHGERFDSVEELKAAIDDYILWYNTEETAGTDKGPDPDGVSESDPSSPNRLELTQSNFWGLVQF